VGYVDTEGAEVAADAVVETAPTADDGVLVQANQSAAVSETNSVSAPVNTVVQTATAVTSAVTTAGAKEAAGGAGGVPEIAQPVKTDTTPKTAKVIVTFELPAE